jgi:phage-related minor tail protein
MTIDERLDRLTERHEALTQSVELLLVETREMRGAQAAYEAAQGKTDEQIRKITRAIELDAENIRALARIAENHERRLTDLQGGE